MKRNKLEQLEKCTIRKVEEGITQVFNNLSHPLRFTLNQRALGSPPTRPTKFFNNLHHSSPIPALPFVPWVLNLCPLCLPDGTSLEIALPSRRFSE